MHGHPPQLLVVDDDHAILTLIGAIAQREGFEVATTATGEEAMQFLRRRPADLILLDLRMPGVSGLETLRAIRADTPQSRVVLMSGYATIDSAVEAVKLGAVDYLTKPFDLQRLRTLLTRIRDETSERRAVLTLDGEMAERLEFCGMIGRAPAMQEVFGLIRRLAPHARTALVTGETGTGKELVARALHALGPRSDKRFITVNCSAVVETLFESELFGHVRGAFTGATDHKAGLLEAADGGTVFLDEIGELPASLQAKLLRVLENGEVQRVGAVQPRLVDVRLIAATNRDLRDAVATGQFRSDLYYRLTVAEIVLPPLRERREDIPYLTASCVKAFGARFGKRLAGLTPEAERLLGSADWHGNVRQLRNVLESACMLAEGEFITETEIGRILKQESLRRGADPGGTHAVRTVPLVEVERAHIVRTLQQVQGNKASAARLLGISRRAFYRQLERHGLHRPAPLGSTPQERRVIALERVS